MTRNPEQPIRSDDEPVSEDFVREGVASRIELSASGESEPAVPACQRVFENVYDQLRQPGKASAEKHGAVFMDFVAQGAERHVDAAASQTPEQLFNQLRQQLTVYVERYRADPRLAEKQQRADKLYSRLTEHVTTLLREQQVDERVAAVFLRSLPALKDIGDYNAVTRNNEAFTPEVLKEKNESYVEVAEGMWAAQPDDAKQEQDGGFYHFNSHLQGNVKNRVYVSARQSGEPGAVLQSWRDALNDTGLGDKVLFKVPTGLSTRFETIILYQMDTTPEADIEKLLETFSAKCPADLLNEHDLPTAIPLRRGISVAPEPANINQLLECTGPRDKTISYNQLIASLTELAFEVAYADEPRSQAESLTPQKLKQRAGTYFRQFTALAGLNPETMMPNAQGGRLPDWAERLSANET